MKQNKPIQKEITVYSQWAKDLLNEVYQNWMDTDNGIRYVRHDSRSITYSVYFHFSTNYYGFADEFWSNLKAGRPKYYD